MTWTNIVPYAGTNAGPHAVKHGVMLSASKDGGRFRPWLCIAFRAELWPDGFPSFLTIGAKVAVQVGSGQYAGQLRIAPTGPFRVGRYPNSTSLRIRIPSLPQQQPGKQQQIGCEFDWQDDWVAITLPPWCRPKQAVAQPALSPEAERRFAKQGRAA